MVTTSPTTEAPAPDLLTEIVRRREQRLAARAKAYARSVPIASDIDPDSCLRRQVLEIAAWQDKPLPDAARQARFEAGEVFENEAIMFLRRDGFEVIEEQVPFELKRRGGQEVVLRGKIDGKIRYGSEVVPFEVKTFMPHTFDRVHSLDDLDRYWWTRRYPSQLQAYLLGHGHPWGFFLLSNMAGSWLPLRMDLDYMHGERIWAFAEAAIDAVKVYRADATTLPPFARDVTECAHCPFFGRTCNPPIKELGAAMLQDQELLDDLRRWHETREASKEHDRIDDRVKKVIKAAGVDRALAGEFAITVKSVPVKAYDVAARVDRRITIERLEIPK